MIPKFRAWDEIDKFIKSVHSINFHDKVVILQDRVGCRVQRLFTDVELMQSTGLKDKNGVEIFEGDIIKAMSQGYSHKGYIKKRNDGLWLIYPAFANKEFWGLCPNYNNKTTVTVIGNIYENKELLEV